MKYSYALLFLLISATSLNIRAQNVEFVLTAGMGTYAMGDLKKINTATQNHIPFETKVTDNFPMTPQFGGRFAFEVSKVCKIGLKYAYSSTGSRIARSDYSGSYRFDNIVNGHAMGIVNSFHIYTNKSFQVELQTNVGVTASIIKIREDLVVADTSISSSFEYSSIGFFIEPVAEATYNSKHFKVGIYGGYFGDFGGKIKDDKGNKSTSTINWSGFRFGIEVGVHQLNR